MIRIDEGLLTSRSLIEYCKTLGSTLVVVTNTHIKKLFGDKILKALQDHKVSAHLLSFPSGEKYKTRETKQALENQLLGLGLGRDTCLLAVGGGTVTDLVGFLASTYCRGVPCVYIPTTLLAMVDASIGGKTGVNVPQGKNMIGSFQQPKAIFMDIDTLETLSEAEMKNGLVECLKHGLILDHVYFSFLEKNAAAILKKDPPLLRRVIEDGYKIKEFVIKLDPTETGLRRLLNFGHTVGHALETLTNYDMAHGQAVALGIAAESYLAMQLGILSQASFERIMAVFEDYKIPLTLTMRLAPEDLKRAMQLDKKSLNKVPRFVILKEIGACSDCEGHYCQSVQEDLLVKTLEWMCKR